MGAIRGRLKNPDGSDRVFFTGLGTNGTFRAIARDGNGDAVDITGRTFKVRIDQGAAYNKEIPSIINIVPSITGVVADQNTDKGAVDFSFLTVDISTSAIEENAVWTIYEDIAGVKQNEQSFYTDVEISTVT